MTSTRQVPKLRFPGFSGEWQTKKLGEFSKTYSGGTPTAINKAYYSGNIPFIKSGEISKASTEQFISEDALKNSAAKMVDKGDILYALYGATSGQVAISQVNGAINQAVLCIRPSANTYFVYSRLTAEKDKILATYIQGGQGNLSAEIVKDLTFALPSSDEQRKIAEFLTVVDGRIGLSERKLELQKKYKQGVMQKIFNLQIRFKNEDGNNMYPDWVNTHLSELGTFLRGLTYTASNVKPSGNLVLRSSNIQRGELVLDDDLQFVDKSYDEELELKKNDIVICMANGSRQLVGKTATYNGGYEGRITVGAFCSIFRSKYPLAKYLFQINGYDRYLGILLSGTNINNLKNSDLEGLTFSLPSSETERQKIADFLTVLDDKIKLEESKLEQARNFKRSLLQQMFV